MRALLQRVNWGSVRVSEAIVAEINRGMVVFLAIAKGDSEKDAAYLSEKIINLRIFSDKEGKFNLSVLDIKGELLVVSQFTLLADTRKGRRPSFTQAAPPAEAEVLFNQFVDLILASGLRVETGRFQQHMLVEIHNEGPVTIFLDSGMRARG